MSKRPEPDQLEQEARRLAALLAGERKAALDVHRRIADDLRLSPATRERARRVADGLAALVERIRKGGK
jgi:hypothetical protein